MHAAPVDVESRHRTRSADEVLLEIPVAGPTSRIVAYAVDAVLMLALEGLAVVLAVALGGITLRGLGEWLALLVEDASGALALAGLVIVLVLLQLVVEVAYFVAWELSASGRSPGKMAVGLRVVRDGGLPLTPFASLVRNLLRVVDQLPLGYVTGLVAIVLSPDGKRLGDLAAGTLVTRLDRPETPMALPPIEATRVGAVRLTGAQVALLDVNAVRLARATLRRLGSLDADRRREIVAVAANALARRLGAAEPLDDPEAFLHAVVLAFELHRR